ncbi:MAG: hypothetical protein ACFFFD_09425 [Promethearchaeota archaeon]
MRRATIYLVMLATLLASSALLILDFPLLFEPPRSEREVIFSSQYNDIARDMAMDSNGSIIVVGARMAEDTTASKFHMVKASSSGQLEWAKTWNISRNDMIVGVEVDSMDNIILAGVSGFNQENTTGLVMKFDSQGELIWQMGFSGIKYNWHWWPPYSDYFGLTVDINTDNIFVVGSSIAAGHESLIAALNSSGSELWRTLWSGPSDSNGTDVTTMWLSSKEGIIITGGIYEAEAELAMFEDEYKGFYTAAFAINGTLRWNHTSSLIWTGLETNEDEFVTATASWRGYNQVTLYTYDAGGIGGCTLDVGEYYSIRIQGFCMNGSEHIIGFGRVESLIVAAPVTRIFTPKYQAPQAPQTLILSCDSSGNLEWYDFLLLRTMSEPCGVIFDSQERMILAGHTSALSLYHNDFFIVFGFQHTPFLPDYQLLLLGFFPLFNIIIPGLLSELRRLHEEGISFMKIHISGMEFQRAIWRLAQVELILFLFLFVLPIASAPGGGPPSFFAYLPRWMQILLFSIPLGLIVLFFLYLVVRVQSSRSTAETG